MIARVVLASCAALAAAGALAQSRPYDPDVLRFGEGLSAIEERSETLRRTLAYCAEAFPKMKIDAQAAYARWVRRQAGYLQLAGVMREAAATAARDSSDRAPQWRALLDQALPTRMDAVRAELAQEIAKPAPEEEKRRICAQNVVSVEARKADLDSVEPEIGKYLHEVAAKMKVRLVGVEALGDVPAPDARRDAAALKGNWRTEKVVHYMANGRFREDPTQCALEYSEERLVSECTVNGRPFRVVYSYQVPEPGRYEFQVIEDKTYPNRVGARAIAAFRVENGKLITSSFPTPSDSDPLRPIEIESVLKPGVLSGRR
jgi:hypothetical protein